MLLECSSRKHFITFSEEADAAQAEAAKWRTPILEDNQDEFKMQSKGTLMGGRLGTCTF